MSSYGLIKITSKIQRADTVADLHRLNHWLNSKGMSCMISYGNTVRALENSVAMCIDRLSGYGLPSLVRGASFYKSILPEITEKERRQFNIKNPQR